MVETDTQALMWPCASFSQVLVGTMQVLGNQLLATFAQCPLCKVQPLQLSQLLNLHDAHPLQLHQNIWSAQ